jgi:hypothetical protein
LGILVVLALPLALFLMVNKGIIAEIRLPFLSIPKLVYLRDSEISFRGIPENIANLWNILRTQSDGLPWNQIRGYGIFYEATLPFFIVGFIASLRYAILDIRHRKLGLNVFVLIWLLAGFSIGALIHVNINRVNLLFIPMVILAMQGILLTFNYIHPKTIIIPLVAYLFFFAGFEKNYFTIYKEAIGHNFCNGLEKAVELASSKAPDNTRIVVDPGTSYPRILFFGKVDLESYLSTVKYTNFPSAFLYVSSFDKYIFTDRIIPSRHNHVYLLENKDDRSSLLRKLGYQVKISGDYVVGYKD